MTPQKPALQETGKQRAARIPLDYYKRPNVLERWKELLGGAALLATLAWLGASWAITRNDDFQSSRGPLASVHQNWDNQCQACHEPFASISSHSASFLGDPLASSKKCQACHSGAVHHAGQTPDLSCAACHRDHRGREASLVNLPDSDCTQCHQDLSKHYGQRPTGPYKDRVTKFAKETHPEFRSIKRDPGKLEFNHQRHLTAGIPLREGKQAGGTLMTLGQLPEAFRERYRSQPQQKEKLDSSPVQLQCASCHQSDASELAPLTPNIVGSTEGRGSGAYMLPVTYENHCQACHPLTVHKAENAKLPELTLPHRRQPKELHQLLDDFFTAKVARGFWKEEKELASDRPPLPGKKVTSTLPETELGKIRTRVKDAETYLWVSQAGCALCHEIKRSADDYQVEPTNVPQVWFQHAKFNHAAHRAVTCQECHPRAESSTSHVDVLIPAQDNCVKCHAPVTEARTPGVRSTCTTCHLYHNGDHSLQGIGAPNRRPEKTRTITKFLLGEE